MTEPTLDEIETHFHITASDRNKIEVFSDDPVWQRKIEKVTQPIKINGRSRWYELKRNQFSLRKGEARSMTEEQRAASAERLRLARQPKGDQP